MCLNNTLSSHQSDRKQHSTTAMKVLNDIVEALDAKNDCTALLLICPRHLILSTGSQMT